MSRELGANITTGADSRSNKTANAFRQKRGSVQVVAKYINPRFEVRHDRMVKHRRHLLKTDSVETDSEHMPQDYVSS